MGQLASDVTEILNYNKSKKMADNDRQLILQEIANDEKNKTNLVKKALSQQRAKYGASGVSISDESANAVLKRLQSETAQPYNEKRESNIKKINKIKTSKPNLLKTLLNRFDDLLG